MVPEERLALVESRETCGPLILSRAMAFVKENIL